MSGKAEGVAARTAARAAGALEATPERAAVARDRVVGAIPAATVQTRPWHRIALGAILVLAAFFDFFRLGREGLGNLYYATTVKSMLTSWHNFFFVSFDPGGFVTVDKPPLGFWVQAASAKLFGFSGWSLLGPQALAGVASVALLYWLVRRAFGPLAGLLAALALAVTPISVVTNRNNTIDSLLVLTVLLAAWAVCIAAERGSLRWLLVCAVILGLGFNIKMTQAFLVLPACWLLYLVAPPLRLWTRVAHLALATVLLLVVSLSWTLAVDAIPADQRPFIGSSTDNTVLELILGHNGLERLVSSFPGLAGSGATPAATAQATGGSQAGAGQQGASGQQGGPSQQPPAGLPFGGQSQSGSNAGTAMPSGVGNAGLLEVGPASPWRFFDQQLAGQISWLLPLAALGLLVAGWQERLPLWPRSWRAPAPMTRRQQALVLWGMWCLPQIVYFSATNGLFHRYYLSMLAPGVAALVGIGGVALWADYRRPGWRGWLLPAALAGEAALQAYLLAAFPDWSRRLTPLVVGLGLLAAAGLVVARLWPRPGAAALARVAAIAGALAVLIAPIVWAAIPVWGGNAEIALPYAGPAQQSSDSLPYIGGKVASADPRLVGYLQANRGQARYLLGTVNASSAEAIILATGEPVMAIGGFTGSDPILTAERTAGLVANGAVRFFLLPQQAGSANSTPSGSQGQYAGLGGANQVLDITRWVNEHCATVATDLWQSMADSSQTSPVPGLSFGGQQALFDCAGSRP